MIEERLPTGVVVRTPAPGGDAPYEDRDARFWLVVFLISLALLVVVAVGVLT